VLEMILSTDMALHFDFMARFEALRRSGISSSPVDDKQQRLICCCIMKSADISNLVFPISLYLSLNGKGTPVDSEHGLDTCATKGSQRTRRSR